MATVIKPELSKMNDCYISKHRYYELKHFCMQYLEWKEICKNQNRYSQKFPDGIFVQKSFIDSPIECQIITPYLDNIALIERICKETAHELWIYILRSVTENLTYDKLRASYGIPCCREYYYKLYRQFFYNLSIFRK